MLNEDQLIELVSQLSLLHYRTESSIRFYNASIRKLEAGMGGIELYITYVILATITYLSR